MRASLPRETVEISVDWTDEGAENLGGRHIDWLDILGRGLVEVGEDLADFLDQARLKQLLEEVLAPDRYDDCQRAECANGLEQCQPEVRVVVLD